MAHSNSRTRYLETVGETSVQWNYLERQLHVLGYAYLGGDAGVASRIFGYMGNVSKIEFIEYLIDRFEKNDLIAEHGHHILKAFDILRENRNVVEHSVPKISYEDEYLGEMAKPTKKGGFNLYSVPMAQLMEFLEDIKKYRRHVLMMCAALNKEDDEKDKEIQTGKPFRDVFASLDKPPLPHRITPLPPPKDH